MLDLKCKIKEVCLSSLRWYNKKDNCFENLTKDEYIAFLSLKSINNIIIQKAGKRNTVVILDRVSYVFEIEKLLRDTSKLKKVAFNLKHKVNREVRHLTGIESNIKSCIDNLLLKNNYLKKEDYKIMRPYGRKPGVSHVLRKVQKPDESNSSPPLRPIISGIGTCLYNLAKFTVNKYTIKDSFHFQMKFITKILTNVTLFDIQSLFTNIPLDETIEICLESLFYKKRKLVGLLKKHVKESLTRAVKSSTYMFNDVYYKQVGGVAMGSPWNRSACF